MSSKLHLAKSRSQSNSSNSQNKKKVISPKNIDDIDNENYYKLTLGASFEYNALNFLLYGIKELVNFPRIVYYPIVEYKDYEEIDSLFLIKDMKDNLDTYYSNFKSIDINNITGERKSFNLKKNELVFVECTFDFEKRNDKISDFFIKIIQFIKLFINAKKIQNLDEYTIKPILLYNNNINLSDKNIKKSVKVIKETIEKLEDKSNNEKFKEIYNNIQIIYCWPTIPILKNITTYNDLDKKLENETKDLRDKIARLENEMKKMKKNNNYNYKRFNNNNYYNYKKYKYNNYKQRYNNYYYPNNDYKYVNNINKRYKKDYKYNFNNNNINYYY